MATLTPTIERIGKGLLEVTYDAPLTEADTCTGIDVTSFGPVKAVSIGVSGTFGTGGDIALQGSHDNSNFATLEDLGGTAISIQAAGESNSRELSRFLRAAVAAGTGVSVTPVIQIFLG